MIVLMAFTSVPCAMNQIFQIFHSPEADFKKGLANMGVSENSVALNPMVNDHYPY